MPRKRAPPKKTAAVPAARRPVRRGRKVRSSAVCPHPPIYAAAMKTLYIHSTCPDS